MMYLATRIQLIQASVTISRVLGLGPGGEGIL